MGAKSVPVVQAMPEFVEWVVASRPDWARDAVWSALSACLAAGWSWPRVVSVTWQSMRVADAAPDDIRRAAVMLPSQAGERRG